MPEEGVEIIAWIRNETPYSLFGRVRAKQASAG